MKLSLGFSLISLVLWLIAPVLSYSFNKNYHPHPAGAVDRRTPEIQYRQIGTVTNSTSNNSSNALSDAEALVKAAQEEARKRNALLVENIRCNVYEIRSGAPPEIIVGSDPTGTGVNGTVAEAAAIVTESISLNSTANETSADPLEARQATTWWMEQMTQNGRAPFVSNSSYSVWRNVKSYGAYGDGVHDDTAAINKAVADGNRCGLECGSTTTLQAVVYFPPGTYLVSSSIIQYYHTQFIGNAALTKMNWFIQPIDRPIIKASSSFVGLGVISSDVYIEGGDGAEWYINQSNFLRQIRNFVIDITAAPQDAYVAALHWQVAQATSLQNIKFIMSTAAGNNQQGIFMENGSGGFMSDLEFEGGALGAYVGNQQFTVRNLKFKNHALQAIQIHWDWGWTWKGLDISNCPIGVHMVKPGTDEIGSTIFIDSKMTDVPTAFLIAIPNPTGKSPTLALFSFEFTRVSNIVATEGGTAMLAGSTGTKFVDAWGLGKLYDGEADSDALNGVWQNGANFPSQPPITGPLLKTPGDKTSGFFERSKPQYETVAASSFVNLKTAYGADGDGVGDDTAALNSAFAATAAAGQILWIPAGVYIVTDTVFIPKGTKVVGQSWSQIMGSGVKFQNAASPYPVVKVGNVGDIGNVEIQDLMFTVRGKTAGAIVLQWNIHAASPGSAAMWGKCQLDTHLISLHLNREFHQPCANR
ncbi:hypothetical protein ABW19_dt0210235 [Dactylella cylindrospora]|nr:hypothetical protein ABW19_dt0210235 [Dactylella cylindrospora]